MDCPQDGWKRVSLVQVDVAVPLFEDLEKFLTTSGFLGRLQQEVGPHRDGDGWQQIGRKLEKE